MDAKKMERFRDGLDGKLYERLNMQLSDRLHQLGLYCHHVGQVRVRRRWWHLLFLL
jgi:hypothetical protein